MKLKKKKRKKSLKTKTKDRLWELVKEYVFLRDKDTCQRCLKNVAKWDRHPSHVFGKGAYPRLEFEVLNVKTLCFHCHLQWWHLVPTEAYQWFTDRFPDRFSILEEMKINQGPLTITELELWLFQVQEAIDEEKANQSR